MSMKDVFFLVGLPVLFVQEIARITLKHRERNWGVIVCDQHTHLQQQCVSRHTTQNIIDWLLINKSCTWIYIVLINERNAKQQAVNITSC